MISRSDIHQETEVQECGKTPGLTRNITRNRVSQAAEGGGDSDELPLLTSRLPEPDFGVLRT